MRLDIDDSIDSQQLNALILGLRPGVLDSVTVRKPSNPNAPVMVELGLAGLSHASNARAITVRDAHSMKTRHSAGVRESIDDTNKHEVATRDALKDAFLKTQQRLKLRGMIDLTANGDGIPILRMSTPLFNAVLKDLAADPFKFWTAFPLTLRAPWPLMEQHAPSEAMQHSFQDFWRELGRAGGISPVDFQIEHSSVADGVYDIQINFGPNAKTAANRLRDGFDAMKNLAGIESVAAVEASHVTPPGRAGEVLSSHVKINWATLEKILTAYAADPSLVGRAFNSLSGPGGLSDRSSDVGESHSP
ncbi:MAG: hypothetical protein WDN72_09805 [Alphaproteobacteria bacterium]